LKENKNISLYWKLQLTGWFVTSFYWGYAAFFESNFIWSIGITDLILDVTVGITLTHLYRSFALKNGWHKLGLKVLVPRMAFAVLVLSLLYMVLIICKLYLVRSVFLQDAMISFKEFFKITRLKIFVTGTRLMSVWVLAYHLYHYSRREIETVKENAKLLLTSKEAQMVRLAGQLNPHFFFNSLNNIKFLVSENPEKARRAIDLLSDILRNSLNNNEDILINIKDEISIVADYLELQKMRFEERLEFDVRIAENIYKYKILPLSIQTLVENAIKHGIEQRKYSGFVNVTCTVEGKFIRIIVQNSGTLRSKGIANGIGLKNLNERLLLQYNGKANLQLTETGNETITATLSIPV
jgi:sensor histidine kinase YesM